MAKRGNDAKTCDAGPKGYYVPADILALKGSGQTIRNAIRNEVARRNKHNNGASRRAQ